MRKVTKNGHVFLVNDVISTNPWMHRFWDMLESGEWEPHTFNIMDKFLTSGTTYVDIGAWIGPTVMYAAMKCSTCFAIEPDPTAYSQLVRHLRLNDIENVIPINKAVLDYNGTATLGTEDLGNSMTRISHTENRFQVACITLESLIEDHGIEDPMFLKIDTEGAEVEILKSLDFFKKHKPTLYLSLHAFWFSNVVAGLDTIREVGKLYKHCYNANLNEISLDDINIETREVVFTDEE